MTNVLTIKSRNSCKNIPFNHTTSQTYTYKDLYQLKTVTGNSSLYLYFLNNSVYQKNSIDHLGSAQTVTNHKGQIHERLEYTPYGELWIDWKNKDIDQGYATPYRFTGKELDQETGFYYYGARYLDPKTSRWLSTDPAMGEYVPSAPVNKEAKKRNGNLPGMGGVFNYVNLHVYHYAGNNPVKLVDPDGRSPTVSDYHTLSRLISFAGEIKQTGSVNGIDLHIAASSYGCFARAHLIADALVGMGFNVGFAYADGPLRYGQDSNNPDALRFDYHVAAAVDIGGAKFVIDPYYSNEYHGGITSFSEWTDKQNALDSYLLPLDKDMMKAWYNTYNKNPDLTISDYTGKWLNHFSNTGEYDYNGFD